MPGTRTLTINDPESSPLLMRRLEQVDPATAAHGRRVARLAVALGRRLGIGGAELRHLALGATLHDVGKLGIPAEVLDKPGPLDARELAQLRCHPDLGDVITGEWELHRDARDAVRSHHERYDGLGYPNRLAGGDIPLSARIVAVADAFDAMTTPRPYNRQRTDAEARDEIVANAGAHFCPAVVAALVAEQRPQPRPHGARVRERRSYFRRNALMRSA